MKRLPDYELKPCPYSCPCCSGSMKTVIMDHVIYVGLYGKFYLDNVRLYRCEKCSWEITPSKTFDEAEKFLRVNKGEIDD